MKRVAPFIAYFLAIVLLAGWLAYPLHLLVQGLGATEIPFHKLVFRLMLLLAVLGVWPLLRYFSSNTRERWGYGRLASGEPPSSFGRGILVGFILGLLTLLMLVVALHFLGVRVAHQELQWFSAPALGSIAENALRGLIIAVIEETWFRGGLYGALDKTFNAVAAIIVTAVLYGSVHFIRPDVPILHDDVTWSSGYTVISNSFLRFSDPAIVDSYLCLIALGVLLALVRLRSGRIAECLGAHAAAVMVIQVFRDFSVREPGAAHAYLAGNFDGVLGWLGFGWFSALGIGYYLVMIHRRKTT